MTAFGQNAESEEHFGASDEDRDTDQDNDDPGNSRHLIVGNVVRQHFGQIQEHTTSFVQHLYAWFDFEIFCQCRIERV